MPIKAPDEGKRLNLPPLRGAYGYNYYYTRVNTGTC